MSYAGQSILLTGDIEERTQRALLERGDVIRALKRLEACGQASRTGRKRGTRWHPVKP